MTSTTERRTGAIRLRPYQSDCVDALIRELHEPRPDDAPGAHWHLAAVLPTGSGKTIIFSGLGDAWHARYPGSKIMILAHRDELISQAANKYHSVAPDTKIGIIKGTRHEVRGNDVVVASVLSLNARRRERLSNWRPDLLVIDEAHHSTAKLYRQIIEWANCPVVGVTATMGRSDGKALGRAAGGIFDKIVYQKSILWMIRQGYLCDVKGRRVVVDDLDLKGMRKVGGDYSESDLSERLLGSSAPDAVAKAVAEHAGGQPGVIFAPTVESAQAFTDAMRDQGFTCETVWGAMPLDRDQISPLGTVVQKSRRRVLREFNAGKIDWLSNCMVLTEGFDAPRAKVAVIARATQSASLYIQMVGRVLRPFPGVDHALVLDVVGATAQHELATLAVLAGKEPRETGSKTLLDLFGAPCDVCMIPADECDWTGDAPCCDDCTHRPIEKSSELIEVTGPTRAVEADLFAGSRQQWLQTYDGNWFISAGERVIFLAPTPGGEPVESCDDECDGCSCHVGHSAPCSHCTGCWEDQPGGYDVAWTFIDKRGGGYIARDVSELSYAMAQGEAAITLDEELYAGKQRAWRKRRASDKQIAYAKALRIYTEGMETWKAGAVGDEISRKKVSVRIDKMISDRMARAGA